MADKLQLAVNAAVRELSFRQIMATGHYGLDHKRQTAWAEYGFKQHLSFDDLYKLYRRGGIAYGAVTKLIGNCWKTNPELIQGEPDDEAKDDTPWERSIKQVFTNRFWRTFAEADTKRLVGRWSAILLHVRDNKQWNAPVTRGRGLEKITAAWATALKVKARDRLGNVTMWQYTEITDDDQRVYRDVHPDRVFILGDRTCDAIGFLEPAYNAFVSLEKVEGGSGEAYLKNAARQMAVNFDADIDLSALAQMYGVSVDELQERFNETARELNMGHDSVIVTQGATTTPIATATSDPTPAYNVNLQTAAAAVDIPTKILVGMQSGERASTEDQAYFDARSQSRRGDLSFDIEDLADKLIDLKIIPPIAEKTVVWDDLSEQQPSEKLASAQIMSSINSSSMGGEAVFTGNEIRKTAGYEPLPELEDLPEIDDEETDPEDPSADDSETGSTSSRQSGSDRSQRTGAASTKTNPGKNG